MTRLDLKVGYSCNMRCRHCAQGNKRDRVCDKPTERIKSELQTAVNKGIREVVFTGGEPTIRKDIFELVNFAREAGFSRIQIQTNGRMFSSKNFTRRMIDAGMNEFSPALNGHIPALHDYIASVPGAWKQTVQGMINVGDYDVAVVTNSVVTKPNYRFLDRLAGLLVKLGADQYQLAFVHPVGRAWENFDSMVPLMTLAAPEIHKGLDVGKENGMLVMAEAVPFCFMKGYEKYVSEKYIPPSVVYEVDFVNEDYDEWRVSEGKWKDERCKTCSAYSVCEGPWKEYVEKRGSEEFVPF